MQAVVACVGTAATVAAVSMHNYSSGGMSNPGVAEPTTKEVDAIAVTASAPSRISGIDVLRGLSILAVVIHHINLRIPLKKTVVAQFLPKQVVSDLGWNGYNGVIVFFAVSGFLITTTCFRRWGDLAKLSLKGFYRFRFARIAPCLVALLAVLSTLHLLHVPWYTIKAGQCSLTRAIIAALTCHINWLEAQRGYLPANWDALWSLSNEEMFYLFFPLLCVITRKREILISVLLCFVAIGPFARILWTTNSYWADNGYLSCADALALGCLSAIAVRNTGLGSRGRVSLQVAGPAVIVFITLFRPQVRALGLYRNGLDVSLLAAGTAIACAAFVNSPGQGSRLFSPLRWFGRNSYEIYLTHMMVIFPMLWVVKRIDPAWRCVVLWYAGTVLLTGVVGAAIARYFSEPMNRRLRARPSSLRG
ncbi:MAG TPA: acyltransferase [candidate division Zixibacteria bacterium]|nr:acyltransferase [candidate division Zixibacteria bacterium]